MNLETDQATQILKRIAEDVSELKITTARIDERLTGFEAKTGEQFKAVDQRFANLDQRMSSFEKRINTQDSRLWGFMAALFIALLGFVGKTLFFPPNP